MRVKKQVAIFAFSNDKENDGSFLGKLEQEKQLLINLFNENKVLSFISPIFIENCTHKSLYDAFQSATVADNVVFFHYSGHANSFQLLLESENGNQSIHADGLMSFISRQKELKFTF